MGLLDSILGAALGGVMGQGSETREPAPVGGGNNALAVLLPIVLSMLANRGGAGAGATGGGLGDVLGNVLGAGQGGGGGLGGVLGGILGGGGAGGALGGLLEQFQRAGFGEQAGSWVGTGQNLPISPDAMGKVFGEEGLAEIARRAGISTEDASQGLSQLLPEVVDRLTPGGAVPDLDQLSASVDDLSRGLGG
ncbi:MAG: YidB family protein [Rhodocyclaceae bacterium]